MPAKSPNKPGEKDLQDKAGVCASLQRLCPPATGGPAGCKVGHCLHMLGRERWDGMPGPSTPLPNLVPEHDPPVLCDQGYRTWQIKIQDAQLALNFR